jgi:hypothetical protein
VRIAVLATAAAAAVAITGCGDNERPTPITIFVPTGDAQLIAAVEDLAAYTGYSNLAVVATDAMAPNQLGAVAAPERVAVSIDAALCAECYALDPITGGDFPFQPVRAGGLLGAQYGVSAALENFGFRFRSPFETYIPPRLHPVAFDTFFGRVRPGVGDGMHTPQIRVRGFQLHTLHPIEAYFSFWEPGDANLENARRIIDWTIKNRGNYVQWVGLDNIDDPAQHAPWKAHTQAIIAYAHARGVRVGMNIQLYGQSNLQQAFDLWDDRTGDISLAESLAIQLPLITDGVDFDVFHISFGEFFSSDPAQFVSDLNASAAALRAHEPGVEVHGFVHVGDEERVDYMGMNLIYYFLVKFADPTIVPDIHTVMFYNLYEDAGGAYHHDNFDEHRAYLLERIAAGQPSSYVPETAYWVSFDNSVPNYFPLYVRNRLLDLERLRDDPAANGNPLDQHIIFSSGWEWGFWLNDYTALRGSYELASPDELIAHAFGDDLAPAAPIVHDLIAAQKTALMDQRLVAYMGGRDQSFELGVALGIVSQPDRVTFAELADADEPTRARVRDDIARLDLHAAELHRLADDADALALPASRWTRELRDGIRVTALRAEFARDAYQATFAFLDGDTAALAANHAEALARIEAARPIVARRHGDLHFKSAAIVERAANHTFYPYGYLHMADTLCFWMRELRQVETLAGLPSDSIPDCIL